MNNYCADLNIDVPLLKDPKFVFPRVRHTKYKIDILDQRIIDFFDQRNLIISLVEIFYSAPYFKSSIHTDGLLGDYSKINFVFGGDKSIMSWFTSKVKKNRQLTNTIGTIFIPFLKDEVELQLQKNIKIALVQVGTPHSVENFQEDRWAVSLVFRNKQTYVRLTMEESIKIFEDIIIS